MSKEEDPLNECGHRNSERVEALKELPSAECPACGLERIKDLEAVMQKCINAMEGSNCLEEQWLIEALKGIGE